MATRDAGRAEVILSLEGAEGPEAVAGNQASSGRVYHRLSGDHDDHLPRPRKALEFLGCTWAASEKAPAMQTNLDRLYALPVNAALRRRARLEQGEPEPPTSGEANGGSDETEEA